MKGKRMSAQVLPHVNLNNMTDVLAGIHENQVYQAVRIQELVEGGTWFAERGGYWKGCPPP